MSTTDLVDQEFLDLAHLAILAEELEQEEDQPRPKKRRVWVKNWVARRTKDVPLFREIRLEDREKFLTDFRLYPEEFDLLLSR